MTATTGDLFGSKTAVLSPDERYRYLLTRECAAGPGLTFIMLNPSTADDQVDDPTIRRCIRFAGREGAGRLVVVNLFALRATDPRELARHPDPAGPRNDEFILMHCRPGSRVVAAWGAHPFAAERARAVTAAVVGNGASLHCLGVTKDGHPRHPLYVRGDAPLLPYSPPERGQ
jgi:hypothetical protein